MWKMSHIRETAFRNSHNLSVVVCIAEMLNRSYLYKCDNHNHLSLAGEICLCLRETLGQNLMSWNVKTEDSNRYIGILFEHFVLFLFTHTSLIVSMCVTVHSTIGQRFTGGDANNVKLFLRKVLCCKPFRVKGSCVICKRLRSLALGKHLKAYIASNMFKRQNIKSTKKTFHQKKFGSPKNSNTWKVWRCKLM